MNIYLCDLEETLEMALAKINENDPDGRKFECDEEKDRCYIGDENFVKAPVIINKQNKYYALRQV